MARPKKSTTKKAAPTATTLYLVVDDTENVHAIETNRETAVRDAADILEDDTDPYIVEVVVKSVTEVRNEPHEVKAKLDAIDWKALCPA